MIGKRINIVLFLLGSLSFGLSHAQSYSFQGVLYPVATVQKVLNVTVTSIASSALNFTSTPNFSDGISIANFAAVQIKSNVAWAFGVSTTTPYFNASGAYASSNMPSQVLAMRLSTQSQNQSLSTTPKTLTTGSKGGEDASGHSFNLSLYADPKYDYGPGIYTITINYTLTAQ